MKYSANIISHLVLLMLFDSIQICAQLSISIINLPESKQETENIYFAGNINGWNPCDTAYQFLKNKNGIYNITFNPPLGKIEFKFTRGSWSSVESNKQNQDIENRIINYTGIQKTIDLFIEGWKEEKLIVSTAAKNVTILKEKFYIPQLYRERKIWIYLPPDYHTTDKSYPVLYMHDGQNLFDASSSFSGEWGVDESLNSLFDEGQKGVIVIGIENGREYRVDEYTAWQNTKYGGGEGDKYVNFIVETLKPYVDANYRTLTNRQHTGIMGSSLGGLISFYAALKHQNVFSKAGVFSPSFWFSEEVYEFAKTTRKQYDMRIFMLGGELESDSLVEEMSKMATILKNNGFQDSEIKLVTHIDGKHNEAYWQREFSGCYLWLFR